MEKAHERSDAKYMTYEEFGRRFFELAVTEERVLAAFDKLAGDSFDFGPIGAGPGKLAKVSAKVDLGHPTLSREILDVINFELVIPLQVDLMIDLTIDQHRFDVEGNVHLRLTPRAAEPLRVIIDVDEPTTKDVRIDVEAESLRGALLRIIASVDTEIKRFVCKFVAKEIRKPHLEAAREIDVASRIDKAWSL